MKVGDWIKSNSKYDGYRLFKIKKIRFDMYTLEDEHGWNGSFTENWIKKHFRAATEEELGELVLRNISKK